MSDKTSQEDIALVNMMVEMLFVELIKKVNDPYIVPAILMAVSSKFYLEMLGSEGALQMLETAKSKLKESLN